MVTRDALEEQARQHAARLVSELVQGSEAIDYRQGTYLIAALAAELGAIVQSRCWELAREGNPGWEVVASEAETLINAGWRCMAQVWVEAEQEDRRRRPS